MKIKDDELELLYDLGRMTNDGSSWNDPYGYYHEQDNISMATCQYGNHKWVYYIGLHVERYWFCTVCDEKDYKRDPPKS